MKKIIAILILLTILAPFSVLANSGDVPLVSLYPKANTFDELKNFSAKINSFLIPNYIGNSYGLLVDIRNKLSEAMNIIGPFSDNVVAEIKSKFQYVTDSLNNLKNYIFGIKSAEDAVNAAKNAMGDKLRVSPAP